jgi:hypothetical protein
LHPAKAKMLRMSRMAMFFISGVFRRFFYNYTDAVNVRKIDIYRHFYSSFSMKTALCPLNN